VTQVVDLDENARKRTKANGLRYFLGRFEDFKLPNTVAPSPLHGSARR
jgi:hypothetical protein